VAGRPKRAASAAPGIEQVRALAHPLRLQLVELFARGPLTAKQAAEKLGQPPTRLYHHVATLERAGLLRLKETRAVRGATEKYFEIARSPLLSSRESANVLHKSTARDREAVGFALFDQARNELLQALAGGLAEGRQPFMAVRAVAWLSPAVARGLQRDLANVFERLRRERKREKARDRGSDESRRRKLKRYSLTIAMIPTAEEAGGPGDSSGSD